MRFGRRGFFKGLLGGAAACTALVKYEGPKVQAEVTKTVEPIMPPPFVQTTGYVTVIGTTALCSAYYPNYPYVQWQVPNGAYSCDGMITTVSYPDGRVESFNAPVRNNLS